MTPVSVRHITNDVDAAVDFYAERLGSNVEMRPGPGFATLARGDLRLLLNRPGAWREAGASFRNDIVMGRGGSQILLEDPSGCPIELLSPPAPEHPSFEPGP